MCFVLGLASPANRTTSSTGSDKAVKHEHTPSPLTDCKRSKHVPEWNWPQGKFVRPVQMQLFARVLCAPPLGQPTVVPKGQPTVSFSVVIESSKSFLEQTWEVVLWHNGHKEGKWAGLRLEPREGQSSPLVVSSDRRLQVYRYYFVKHLLRPGDRESINFTLKFRTSSSDTWKWVKENFSVKDGELCFQPAKLPSKLGNYLEGLHGTSHSVTSEVPEALLWLVTTTVHSGYNEDALGIPKSFTRWFSLARISSPWIAPRHGQGKFAPAEDCILSSFLRSDGLHLVVLPVSGVNDVLVTLRSDSQGYIIIHSKKDSRNYSSTSLVNILIAAGRSFEAALAAVMYQARSIVANSPSIGEKNDSETQMLLNKEIKPEWMESWYDGLTYCTWNALGQNLNQQKIFDALDDLKSNNVNITNLIIDDNWQSLDNAGSSQFNRGMTEFEANKEGFPKGLKHAITRIRDNHPSIEHVAVWHALFGYWGGISPAGIIADMYKTKVVRKQGGIASDLMTVVDADDAPRFYEDFYKFLLSSGVDTVKTDAQCFLDLIVDLNDRQRFITTYQDAWTIASLRYFSTKAISCMSQVPQIIFHTQFPTDKPRLMVRNSNDFFPDVPSSHPWHIFSNAHNAAFTSFLNVIPDWDMFQTSHPYSSFHAAGRCVSAGPIHITDEPGKHDLNLLKQMTAQTTNGKTIILRPDSVGKTMNVYTAYEEERFLKVCTFVGGKGGTSILGCFNISERWLSELIQLNEFRGIESDEEYIIRTFTSGELSPMISRGSEFPLVLLDLDIKGWEILTAYPLQAFTLRGSRGVKDLTKLAILGLLGKMTGAAAVVESSMQVEETGRLKVKAALKALGSLGLYISTLPNLSVEDHFMITIHNKVIPVHTVRVNESSSLVLEIDIEKAWNEMGLNSGWSNEISVEIFIG